MQTGLSGRTILVTGATGGIGGAIARWAAADGAKLVLTGRRPTALAQLADEFRAQGTPVAVFTGDLTDERFVAKLLEGAKVAFGGLDGVVHCAGEGLFGSVMEQSLAEVEQMWASNVKATFLLLREALPRLSGRRGARIVVPVGLAARNVVSNGAAYAASKHAVAGLLRSATAEARRHGVALCLLYNGTTQTPFIEAQGMRPSKDKVLQAEDVAAALGGMLTQASPTVWTELVLQPEGSLVG